MALRIKELLTASTETRAASGDPENARTKR